MVQEFKPLTDIPDLYGYFCLGCISSAFTSIPYVCEIKVEGVQEFTTLLLPTISRGVLVLSDFSKIPDIAVLDSSRILSEVEKEFTKYQEIKYSDIYGEWIQKADTLPKNCVWGPYLPPTTGITGNSPASTITVNPKYYDTSSWLSAASPESH